MSQNIIQYVPLLSIATFDFGMEDIVFDPETLLTTTCASLPNSLDKDLYQTILQSLLTRCLYSCANPVSGWMTAFISSFIGYIFASDVTVEI